MCSKFVRARAFLKSCVDCPGSFCLVSELCCAVLLCVYVRACARCQVQGVCVSVYLCKSIPEVLRGLSRQLLSGGCSVC